MFFNAERPCMRVCPSSSLDSDVHREAQKPPNRLLLRRFRKRWPSIIEEKNQEVAWQNTQSSFEVKTPELHAASAIESVEKLRPNQKSAKHEKKIDARPSVPSKENFQRRPFKYFPGMSGNNQQDRYRSE